MIATVTYVSTRAGKGMLTSLMLALALSACGSQHDAGSTPVPFSTVTGPRGTEVARIVFPYGSIPRGWKTYRGMGVPFAMAYPAGWSVDQSNAPVGQITFAGASKSANISGDISTRALLQSHIGLAVLLRRLLNSATAACEGGRRTGYPESAQFSRATFATETARCSGEEAEKEGTAFYFGAAVKDGREWTFVFRCPLDDLGAIERRYFVPMLRTLHIYKLS